MDDTMLHLSTSTSFYFLCTVFLRSDAAATTSFAARFVRLLFEGSVYFLGNLETPTMAG